MTKKYDKLFDQQNDLSGDTIDSWPNPTSSGKAISFFHPFR
jgi:hypothetical protein